MDKVLEYCHNGEYSDNELVQFIEVIGRDYLGLKTIANKARELATEYNNVKYSAMKKVPLFGAKFVIDNE